ncbi:N-acetylneuraminate synthase family protein [Halobacillus sp. Marseille-Q1614]|uniref:N-acetylneuraminate synthase family protein n=1 Tax=Halobacillus sp. Marseille-Q1614 TaxID=2709134 RepID=UPI00157089E3|nr:N-acetylneuraminate synthase family protein [Halobacillus sp. Marseille-Q1614]
MDPTVVIDQTPLGNARTYIVAEAASNHDGDLKQAKELIKVAAEAGADAVKFQLFQAKQHYSRYTPDFKYLKKHRKSTFKIIESLELNREWILELSRYAESTGITFLSTACDYEAVDLLGKLNIAAFKVSSFDLPDLSLIKHMARYQKPVILSTGMANYTDIQAAINSCLEVGNHQIVLLQCTSLYPAPVDLSNLKAIQTMRQAFGCLVGYSDHTIGDHIPLASIPLGSCLLEKHFTIDRSLTGPDHPFAMEPNELQAMVAKIRDVEKALGDGLKNGPRNQEVEMFDKGRRSLHTTRNIAKGDIIKEEDLCIKRPGYGVSPQFYKHLVGMTVKKNIKEDHWICWEDFK